MRYLCLIPGWILAIFFSLFTISMIMLSNWLPVLFVFGRHDNLIGDPDAARALVRDIPDVQVEIVDAEPPDGGRDPGRDKFHYLQVYSGIVIMYT